jgi:disulfide bond formation protein DsbB
LIAAASLRLNARFSKPGLRPKLCAMMSISSCLTAQRWPILAAIASALILGGAYFFQYVLGYDPCALCYDQRHIHQGAIAAGLVGGLALMFVPALQKHAIWICLVLGAIYLYSAGFAAWHAGIEYDWWDGPATCTSTGPVSISTDDLMSVLDGGGPVVLCDEAAWTLLGISMAGYNALMSLGLALASIFIGLKRR